MNEAYIFVGIVANTLLVTAFFVRIENRLTRCETMIEHHRIEAKNAATTI